MAKRAAGLRPLAIELDRSATVPLYRQVYAALRRAIVTGELLPGARLPSTRALAARLGVSRNTISSAYEQLLAEGFVRGRVGSGTRVARALPETYLRELLCPSGHGFSHAVTTGSCTGALAPEVLTRKSFHRVVQESCYPARVAFAEDSEGNLVYLYDAG